MWFATLTEKYTMLIGEEKRIPLTELERKSCKFEETLKSGVIKKSTQGYNELVWGLSLTEII